MRAGSQGQHLVSLQPWDRRQHTCMLSNDSTKQWDQHTLNDFIPTSLVDKYCYRRWLHCYPMPSAVLYSISLPHHFWMNLQARPSAPVWLIDSNNNRTLHGGKPDPILVLYKFPSDNDQPGGRLFSVPFGDIISVCRIRTESRTPESHIETFFFYAYGW